MKSILGIIKQHIARNETVFVFPSELVASFWMHEILKAGDVYAVAGRRFISWDRFKEEALVLSREETPANRITRAVFAESELAAHASTPLYRTLLPLEYPESLPRFRRDLVTLLPELHELVRVTAGKTWNICIDLNILHKRYCAFLHENRLFEPSALPPVLGPSDNGYILFFPELVEDFNDFAHVIENAPGIRRVGIPEPESLPKTTKFVSQRNELRYLFERINDLNASGVALSDISVSVPRLPDIQDYLVQYARIYGVPLSIRQGQALSVYPWNRLWSMISDCVSSGCDYDSMRNLLLNRAVPFRDSGAMVRLAEGLRDCCCAGNWTVKGRRVDFSRRQLTKAGLADERDLYVRLTGQMEKITLARTFVELRGYVQRFIHEFLNTGADSRITQLSPFQSGLDILSDFCAAEGRIRGMQLASPFSLWQETLAEKPYSEKVPDAGLAVFPYRVAAGSASAYHFIINGSADNLDVRSRRFAVLSDEEREQLGESVQEFTRDFIRAYRIPGTHTEFSFSEKGFSGPGLAPAFFLEEGSVIPCDNEDRIREQDSAVAEQRFWAGKNAGGFLRDWQESGLELFCARIGVPPGKDMTRDALGPDFMRIAGRDDDGVIALSSSTVDALRRCPFKYCFERVLKIQPYEHILETDDPRITGLVEHEILGRFMENATNEKGVYIYTPQYESLMSHTVDEVLRHYGASGPGLLPVEWERICETVRNHLAAFPAAEKEVFEGYAFSGAEMELHFTPDPSSGILLRGIIDRVSVDGDGGAFVVDYKKRLKVTGSSYENAEDGLPESVQLPFYLFLLELNDQKTAGAAYYDVQAAKYDIVFSASHVKARVEREKMDSWIRELARRLPEYGDMLRQAFFPVTENEKNCIKCPYRPLCRARYVVRSRE